MTWILRSRIVLAVILVVLVGCESGAPTHDAHGVDARAVQGVGDVDVELVGMPGMDDPIPARSVEVSALGLSCPLCAHNLDKQLMMIEGVASVEVDLATGLARVVFEETGCVTPRQIITAVEDAGFSVTRVVAVHIQPETE